MNSENLDQNKDSLRRRYRRYYTWISPVLNKPQTKAYAFLALSIFTVAFFVFFAIRPTLNTIFGLKKQIDDNRVVEKKLQEKITALSQLQAEYEIIQPDLTVLNQALPTRPDLAGLVKTIEKLTSDNQASLAAVQVGETDLSSFRVNSKADPQNLPLSPNGAIPISLLFTTEGDFTNIAKLISELNLLPRLFSTQTILIAKGLGSVVVTLRVNAYYLPIN